MLTWRMRCDFSGPLRPHAHQLSLHACCCAQWATMLVIEQMQRWRCHTYNPRTTVVAPYSSTEVIAALPDATKTQFLFFRCAHLLRACPVAHPLPLLMCSACVRFACYRTCQRGKCPRFPKAGAVAACALSRQRAPAVLTIATRVSLRQSCWKGANKMRLPATE